jgi:hypothetical protein
MVITLLDGDVLPLDLSWLGKVCTSMAKANKLIRRAQAMEKQSLFRNSTVKEDDGFVMKIQISEVTSLSPLIDHVGIRSGRYPHQLCFGERAIRLDD